MLVAYVILSLIIGIIDVCRATAQENELASYPIGDIGEYIVPKPILGVHNFIFLPSWLVIGLVVLWNRIFNR